VHSDKNQHDKLQVLNLNEHLFVCLNCRDSLQLSLESLPDAPVTEVRTEEKTNVPADTEAPAEDVDDVIELPDVPVKAPKRPEASEKTKGFDLMLLYFQSLPCFIGL
jgi:hypothetical protein